MKKIYEIVDETDDERYFSMGFFLDLESAKTALQNALEDNYPLTEYAEDSETVKIRERTIGWSTGKNDTVFTLIRNRVFVDDDKDKWVIIT